MNAGPAAHCFDSQHLRGRCSCKGKWFYSGASHLEDGGLSSQSPSQHLSAGRGVYKVGEGKQNKEIGGEAVDMHTVPLLVPIWSLLSASWSWPVPAKFLHLGKLCHPKSWSPFLVQVGTGTADACKILIKKLLIHESSMSLLVQPLL